jgi:hypothetical protein
MHMGEISDYLVNLRGLNQMSASPGQGVRAQIKAELTYKILTTMYHVGRSLMIKIISPKM